MYTVSLPLVPERPAHHAVQVDVVVHCEAVCVCKLMSESATLMVNRIFLRGFTFIIVALLFAALVSAPLFAQDARPTNTDLKFHKFVPAAPPQNNAAAASARQASTPDAANAAATQQIQLLLQEKSSRTPAQQKIDSNVLYTIRMMSGQPAAPGFQSLYTGVDLDDQDRIVVDIVADVTPDLLQKLESAGALVLSSYPDYRAIRAIIPPNQIESIAASPDVSFIGRKAQAMTARFKREPQNYVLRNEALAYGFEARAAKVKKQIAAFLAQQRPGTNSTTGVINTGQGSVTTEGDATHLAARARGVFGVNGSGLKIGVLSDSANATGAATAAQKTGDLPATCPGPGGPCLTILQDGLGFNETDEGTAMLEIVYDMAPGASLYFATADASEAGFASNILALKAAGCNIIVDDVFYFDEPVFQDGAVAQAVNTVTAAGALYFSSAGNEGNIDAGTAGYFEGDFNDIGSPTFPNGAKSGTLHNFHTGALGDPITAPGEGYVLQWADPFGASTNDYDLFYLNSTGIVVSSSTNLQTGNQNPVESIDPPVNAGPGDQLAVFKSSVAGNRLFALKTIRGTLSVATAGETWGHSAAVAAFSVAAAPAAGAFETGSPSGPFPNPFTSANLLEPFTSDGPRRIIFNADGSAITPGNFSSTGGTVRNKPDITAADGVSTTLPVTSGLNPFYGTSAAAPHAASVAALIMSAKPSLTPAQIRSTLTSTALDIMAPGFDRDSGNGIVMAYPALNSLGLTPAANPEILSVTANENPGNGNGIIDPGEGASLVIQLKNPFGVVNATGITGVLTTNTPGVTITQPATSAFPDIPFGSGIGSNLSPFTFTVASNVSCALNIQFTLTLTYSGGPTPTKALNFSLQTGVFNINNLLGGSTPAGLPAGVTFATGLQTNRLSRNGVPSTCSSGNNIPGIITTGPRTFDSYSFVSTHNGCTPLTLTSSHGVDLFTSLYQPSFVPSSISTNHIADAGLSGSPQGLSFFALTPDNYTIVVNDTSPNGTATGDSYTLQIPSCLVTNPSNINHPPIASAHNVTVTATTVGGTANASVNNNSSDPDAGDTITLTQTPPGPYPIGTTNVQLTVVDSKGATSQASANVTVLDDVSDLTITMSHAGFFQAPNFEQGDVGDTFTMTIANIGGAPTSGSFSVLDTLPSNLTATAIQASPGLTCTLATLTCTQSAPLPSQASTLVIISVNVPINAPATVSNSATVSGGAEINLANDSATDTANVNTLPDLTIAMTHTGNFAPGQTGATYSVVVGNIGGSAPRFVATVVETPPVGLTVTALSGNGWVCTLATLSCTNGNLLSAGGALSPLVVTVNVANNAPATVTNVVTVSGGPELSTSNDTASDLTTIAPPADLSIASSHSANFTQGQTGASYTLIASNIAAGPTSGTVTVVDTLPTGLTATSMTGIGWACTLATATCTRSDVLGATASFSAITLTANVSLNASATVTNTATVSGGGEVNTANDTATDVTSITQLPDMTINMTIGPPAFFLKGQTGAHYAITVTNSGAGPTSAPVTVVATLPPALTATAIDGVTPGWTCTLATLSCTRADVLQAGQLYSSILLTMNVDPNAPAAVTSSATVSGGGEAILTNDSVSFPTTITSPPSVTLSATSLTFSNQAVGTTSASKQITVTNSGGQTLTFLGIAATFLSNTTNWAIAPGTTCANGVSVIGGGQCVINITFTPTAGGPVGPDTLTLNDNATPSAQQITLTGSGIDFSTGGPGAPVTVTAGQTANFVITLTPGAGGFANTVTFSASGLPSASSASFNPTSLTPGSTAGSTTLSISTTARGIVPPSAKPNRWTQPRSPIWILCSHFNSSGADVVRHTLHS